MWFLWGTNCVFIFQQTTLFNVRTVQIVALPTSIPFLYEHNILIHDLASVRRKLRYSQRSDFPCGRNRSLDARLTCIPCPASTATIIWQQNDLWGRFWPLQCLAPPEFLSARWFVFSFSCPINNYVCSTWHCEAQPSWATSVCLSAYRRQTFWHLYCDASLSSPVIHSACVIPNKMRNCQFVISSRLFLQHCLHTLLPTAQGNNNKQELDQQFIYAAWFKGTAHLKNIQPLQIV
jgi:hypothetical protein